MYHRKFNNPIKIITYLKMQTIPFKNMLNMYCIHLSVTHTCQILIHKFILKKILSNHNSLINMPNVKKAKLVKSTLVAIN